MRLKVTAKIPKLSVLYWQRFMSLIKEALNLSNYQYREKFYPDKNSEKSKVPKPFCFAVVIPPDKQIIRETVFFNDKPVDIEVFTFSDKSFISFIFELCGI